MIYDKKIELPALGRKSMLVLLFVLIAGCGEQRFAPRAAPDFSLPLLDKSGQVSLQDYQGDVVYLSFWASWCLPCRQEMPILAQLWERHRDNGFQVLAINVDDDPELALQFAQQYNLPFTVLLDSDRAVSTLYGVPGFPTHYIVDRRGRIRFSGLGFNLADVGAISQEVETLLAETSDAAD
jgi:peroxiredoxin